MELDTRKVGSVTVVRLNGSRLDAAQAVRFKEGVREVSEGGAGHILLDLAEINFMDSSGLGAVVTVMKQMGKAKTLELAALTPSVAKVFKLTRMDSIFNIYGSVEEALAADIKAAG